MNRKPASRESLLALRIIQQCIWLTFPQGSSRLRLMVMSPSKSLSGKRRPSTWNSSSLLPPKYGTSCVSVSVPTTIRKSFRNSFRSWYSGAQKRNFSVKYWFSFIMYQFMHVIFKVLMLANVMFPSRYVGGGNTFPKSHASDIYIYSYRKISRDHLKILWIYNLSMCLSLFLLHSVNYLGHS